MRTSEQFGNIGCVEIKLRAKKDFGNNFLLSLVIIVFAFRKLALIRKAINSLHQVVIQGGLILMDRSKIKVVKRSDIKREVKKNKTRAVSPRAAAREMVTNVTDWVADLKERKTVETKLAIETLFSANRQPRES